MINYVIINGVNSNTKNGLMINELPPISKPQMRSNIEEIDGRDGDIITKLGYSAYDKTITIGLWGTSYDVNDIIAFFNKEGTITFSNEPDKYYKFTMLEQIDIERLLKFKQASITFHCQPFKYPTEETPIEIEYEYVEQDNVESANMTNTEGDTFLKIDLKGNTSQYTTTGKQEFNSSLIPSSIVVEENGRVIKPPLASSGTGYVATYILLKNFCPNLQVGDTVYLYCDTNYDTENKYIQLTGSGSGLWNFGTSKTLTEGDLNGGVSFYTNRAASGETSQLILTNFRITKTQDASWEPYTNGASPNPDYPQQIHEVSGDNEVVVCGKNIANLVRSAGTYTGNGTQFSNNQYFINMARDSGVGSSVSLTSATTDTIVVKGRYNQGIGFPRKCKPNTYYSLQATSTSADARVYMSFFDNTGTFISGSASDTSMQRTQQSPANAYWVIPVFAVVGSSLVDTTFTNIMLEESNAVNTYEPYNGDTYELDLGVENLLDISSLTTKTPNGLTITRTNDEISITGTRNEAGWISLINFTLPIGTYTFSFVTSGTMPREPKVLKDYDQQSNTFSVSDTTQTYRIAIGGSVNDEWNCILKLQIEEGTKANSYSPYGQTPIKMRGIGTYEDYFVRNSGKNLFDESVATHNCSVSDGIITITSNTTDVYIQGAYVYSEANKFLTLPSGNYYLKSTNSNVRITLYGDNGWLDTTNSQPITLASETNFGGIRIRSSSSLQNVSFGIMLSTENTMFEPYGTGQWCKYNAIGEVVLDGSENWAAHGSIASWFYYDGITNGYVDKASSNTGKCNYFKQKEYNSVTSLVNGEFAYGTTTGGTTKRLVMKNTDYTTVPQFKTWLGTHNTILYYVLSTPYLSLIEDNNLIEQLDNIQNAMSYEGTTNVMQINNDKAFLMDLKAMKKDTNEVVVNNIGNIYSKPTIALEGTGDINIYLNGTQMLKATLTDKMTIDTTNLEAYNPDTMTLLNRQLVGDISKFTLNSGENTIKMDGDLTKATITDYTRYL